MWSSALPVSLFFRISLFIAVLSHLLGLLGTACRRSARFARFARSRASRARRLGPSWARLGLSKPPLAPRLLKSRFGDVLGASWTVSAPSWSVLAASWAVLAPSWAILGASWPPKGLPRSLQEASKTPPKTRSNIESSWKRSELKKPIKTNEKP